MILASAALILHLGIRVSYVAANSCDQKGSLLLYSVEGSDPPILAKSLIFGDGGLWRSSGNERKCDYVSRSVMSNS